MSKLRFENDPVYQELLSDYEKAHRQHKRALTELRRLYIFNENPDPIKAALFQQIAHEAEMKLGEVTAAFSRFAWELSPYSKAPEHLEQIKEKRAEAVKRMETPPASPKGVTITMRLNGRTRHFQE